MLTDLTPIKEQAAVNATTKNSTIHTQDLVHINMFYYQSSIHFNNYSEYKKT